VVRGRAEVIVANDTFVLEKDQSTYIPKGTVHRLANVFEEPLEIIEVQTGAYLGEDDIERLEDDFYRQSDD
jgi:mannose-6-phosphate isomerase-like protein (cupin superfamily)